MEATHFKLNSTSPEPDAKRRKLRKGTTSCWDCKKRKVKCTFDATSDTVCISCRRRGAPCIGQDQPEDEVQIHSQRDALLDRMQRVESLLERLIEVNQSGERSVTSSDSRPPIYKDFEYFTPKSDDQSPHEPLVQQEKPRATTPATKCVAPPLTEEMINVSKELVKAFPSQADIDTLCKSDYMATFCKYAFIWCVRNIIY